MTGADGKASITFDDAGLAPDQGDRAAAGEGERDPLQPPRRLRAGAARERLRPRGPRRSGADAAAERLEKEPGPEEPAGEPKDSGGDGTVRRPLDSAVASRRRRPGQGCAARPRPKPDRGRHRRGQLAGAGRGSWDLQVGGIREAARAQGRSLRDQGQRAKTRARPRCACPAVLATCCDSPSSTCSGELEREPRRPSAFRTRRAPPRRNSRPRRAPARRLGERGAQSRQPGVARQDRPLPAGGPAGERWSCAGASSSSSASRWGA